MTLNEMYNSPYGVLHGLYYRFWKENDEREQRMEEERKATEVDGQKKKINPRTPPADMISEDEVRDILEEVGL